MAPSSLPLNRFRRLRAAFLVAGPLLAATLLESGCSGFIARRMAQAPNTYPTWLAPAAPVRLAFDERVLAKSPEQFAEVGPPAARLRYRVVEPADYHLQVVATASDDQGKKRYRYEFRTQLPEPNAWTSAPRGTVFLLHGYGLAEFAMAPWAFRLAEDGWRCVLVDLRGHGKSTGKMIYYGTVEARDLSQLLDQLSGRGQAASRVAVVGDSYGAALALRWKTTDPRVGWVVAMAPYGVLADAVVNLCHDYAHYLPREVLLAGLAQLPAVLGVSEDDLDMTAVLARHPVAALFVAGAADTVIPTAAVRQLEAAALPGSELIVVPGATHETLPYHFDELAAPVLKWLGGRPNPTPP
jgi:pimeloyl-ACP methyl ester carboxylesterase